MPPKKAGAREPGVTVSASPEPGHDDGPTEGVVAHARTAILNEPDVIAHLLHLDDLRTTPRVTRYVAALERSPLREWFTWEELGHLVSIVRERLALGVWGSLAPVGPSGAGPRKQPARSMSLDAIELGVADFVRRHFRPERRSPHLGAVTAHGGQASAKLRKLRQRFRELPYRLRPH
jgi:hypothetical protein